VSRASRDKGNRIERQIVALHATLGVKAERVPFSRRALPEQRRGPRYDILFLRRDRAEPMIVLPWRVWARLLSASTRKPLPAPLASLSIAGQDDPPQPEPVCLRLAARAVVADDGREIRLTVYTEGMPRLPSCSIGCELSGSLAS
jgi:hypothetical protein